MPKQKRRIMRKLKIDELSNVDRPAQAGARAVLMKRDDTSPSTEDPEAVRKFMSTQRAALTSEVDNHTHLIPLTDYDGLPVSAGQTSFEADHAHPFIVQEDGSIVLGAVRGHTHEIAAVSKADSTHSTEDDPMSQGNDDKTTDAKVKELEDQLETLKAERDAAKAYAELTDAQKAYHAELDEAAAAEFLKLDAKAREAKVEKAQADDPVVYTAGDGTEYRKSDDERMIRLAKQADENAKLAKQQAEELEQERLAKRAAEELPNLPGETPVRAALLKAVDGIEDETTRKAAHEALKAGNAALAKALDTRGHGGGGGVQKGDADPDDPSAQLDQKAAELAKAEGISETDAYVKVLETPEGQELYNKVSGH